MAVVRVIVAMFFSCWVPRVAGLSGTRSDIGDRWASNPCEVSGEWFLILARSTGWPPYSPLTWHYVNAGGQPAAPRGPAWLAGSIYPINARHSYPSAGKRPSRASWACSSLQTTRTCHFGGGASAAGFGGRGMRL